jgi:hypothetical protein
MNSIRGPSEYKAGMLYLIPDSVMETNSPLLPLLLKHLVEMLLSVLQTYAAIILFLLCCCNAVCRTDNCSQHSRPSKPFFGKCDLTKITATGHTTNERMFSSWVIRKVAGLRAVRINMHPPQVICTERAKAASIIVIFDIIYATKNLPIWRLKPFSLQRII